MAATVAAKAEVGVACSVASGVVAAEGERAWGEKAAQGEPVATAPEEKAAEVMGLAVAPMVLVMAEGGAG